MRRQRLVHLSSIFRLIEQTCLIGKRPRIKTVESCFSELYKTVNLFEIDRAVVEKSRPEHDKNEYFYAIRCRSEVAGEVISCESIKTREGHDLLNFEAVSLVASEKITFSHLRNAETTAGPFDLHCFVQGSVNV